MHGKTPPSLAAPQRTNGSIRSIFGGEIGTGMGRVPAEFVTRPGGSLPTSPRPNRHREQIEPDRLRAARWKRQRRAWLPQLKVEEATIMCCAYRQESR